MFPYTRLKALWNEAVQQWPVSVRTMNGQSLPGFWLVGGQGIYLKHNGARPKGSATVAYANECDPLKDPFENWLVVKRAIFGDSDGMEFVEAVMIGTAVDGGCDIEVMFDHDTMTVTVVEKGKASLRWQSLRTRHAQERYD
ncbi:MULTISPECIES: DUF3085 domain-containing protein [unclassified Bradyrhizobium]|uniref:DUF3085 domain-containing protein n=1 Tax=unclassified Bradyrhizobium TaxID=2631580 RepID=UPI001FD8920A|nr:MULTISPECIES: DUF3085 domain-containing protein [unclassified Bradyrhizobium]MCP3465618.1 DUF3085 domain-containing protein [Bradyrhizobium sp. CCGUVB23]